MYRGVATALVALAAFDYFYLDGKYLHSVQAVANSLLHFSCDKLAPAWASFLRDTVGPNSSEAAGDRGSGLCRAAHFRFTPEADVKS
jgi:hypothetical protein